MVMNPETKLIKQAIKLKKKMGMISIAYLQRKMKLPYEDAKRIMEVLEGWHV